jgi:hypothetical protein
MFVSTPTEQQATRTSGFARQPTNQQTTANTQQASSQQQQATHHTQQQPTVIKATLPTTVPYSSPNNNNAQAAGIKRESAPNVTGSVNAVGTSATCSEPNYEELLKADAGPNAGAQEITPRTRKTTLMEGMWWG